MSVNGEIKHDAVSLQRSNKCLAVTAVKAPASPSRPRRSISSDALSLMSRLQMHQLKREALYIFIYGTHRQSQAERQ